MGLIDWIGKQTEYVIMSVGPESRLAAAIVLILWISAIASAFVDNLPLTTMMVRIAVDLSKNSDLHLPLQPLIWSLSFGACLGGEFLIYLLPHYSYEQHAKLLFALLWLAWQHSSAGKSVGTLCSSLAKS